MREGFFCEDKEVVVWDGTFFSGGGTVLPFF